MLIGAQIMGPLVLSPLVVNHDCWFWMADEVGSKNLQDYPSVYLISFGGCSIPRRGVTNQYQGDSIFSFSASKVHQPI